MPPRKKTRAGAAASGVQQRLAGPNSSVGVATVRSHGRPTPPPKELKQQSLAAFGFASGPSSDARSPAVSKRQKLSHGDEAEVEETQFAPPTQSSARSSSARYGQTGEQHESLDTEKQTDDEGPELLSSEGNDMDLMPAPPPPITPKRRLPQEIPSSQTPKSSFDASSSKHTGHMPTDSTPSRRSRSISATGSKSESRYPQSTEHSIPHQGSGPRTVVLSSQWWENDDHSILSTQESSIHRHSFRTEDEDLDNPDGTEQWQQSEQDKQDDVNKQLAQPDVEVAEGEEGNGDQESVKGEKKPTDVDYQASHGRTDFVSAPHQSLPVFDDKNSMSNRVAGDAVLATRWSANRGSNHPETPRNYIQHSFSPRRHEEQTKMTKEIYQTSERYHGRSDVASDNGGQNMGKSQVAHAYDREDHASLLGDECDETASSEDRMESGEEEVGQWHEEEHKAEEEEEHGEEENGKNQDGAEEIHREGYDEVYRADENLSHSEDFNLPFRPVQTQQHPGSLLRYVPLSSPLPASSPPSERNEEVNDTPLPSNKADIQHELSIANARSEPTPHGQHPPADAIDNSSSLEPSITLSQLLPKDLLETFPLPPPMSPFSDYESEGEEG